MRLLLDTQCWLWWHGSPERLNQAAQKAIENPRNQLFFSAASSWEIAIKFGLGKLRLPRPPSQYVPERLLRGQTRPLAVEHSHALEVASLPSHHKDPFDRLLIAQARIEKLRVLTADPSFSIYEVEILWAGPPGRLR